MRWQFIDRIVELDPGQRALGIKCFTRSEEFFQDHFPGMPIVPGVLQIEMMAQLAGKCLAQSLDDILPVLAQVKSAKFYRNIRPGDQCFIRAELTKVTSSFALADASIEVEGQKMSQASIMFGLIDRSQLSSESFDEVTQDFLRQKKKEKDSHG